MSKCLYSYNQLMERLNLIKEIKGDFIISVQFGQILLLNKDNEILLNLSPLVEEQERRDK